MAHGRFLRNVSVMPDLPTDQQLSNHSSFDGFLLRRSARDLHDRLHFELWIATNELPLCVELSGQEAVMFVEREQAATAQRRIPLELKSLTGHAVDGLYFRSQRELIRARDELRARRIFPLEADVKPVERFLMERFVTGAVRVTGPSMLRSGVRYFKNPRIQSTHFNPQLSVLSLDIETVGLDGALLSVAGIMRRPSQPREERRVFLVRQFKAPPLGHVPAEVSFHDSEAQAISSFCAWLQAVDPDLIVGWNVIDFDLSYLHRRAEQLRIKLPLGRAWTQAELLTQRDNQQLKTANVPGRVVLDGITTLRNSTIMLESYALNDVARDLLGDRKAIKSTSDNVAEITRMAKEDPLALARYNLHDCQLVLDIFDHARLFDFVVERQKLTGLPLDRQGGSVAAFDQLYLPRLHRAGYVARSVGDARSTTGSPGGHVMDSTPGLFRNVIVLDFKSLYPSIIRTFLVDPLGLAQPGLDPIPGFDGARFAREGHILPGLIRTLWDARDEAKRENNAAMSQAIKIMMNSFYGVLGTPGCRFYDHRLASSITKRGHDIILQTRTFIEQRGRQVIYGDTDSLFVLLEPNLNDEQCRAIGHELSRALTEHFQVQLRDKLKIDSHLELQFEKHYRHFFMPTMRGSDIGTKKRYAGVSFDAQGGMHLVFKGLEAVRTDWTPLARQFQRELFRRVFSAEPYEEYVRGVASELMAGAFDVEQLVYQKRIRRPLDEYVRNVPPHIQAARKLKSVGRRVRYVITVNGPEPASDIRSALDYEHYLYRQLEPAAEGLLQALHTSFAQLAGKQLQLF